MGAKPWTNEQMQAITEKGCNLLVAAAAGAGKTAVLVERIIQKITDTSTPVDIDRLLIVTFTNAAATEMRERIADAIAQLLEEHATSSNVQRQLTLLNKASIMTLHSFCLEVIRSNFQSISIDPGFRISDATEATLMKLEILNDLFEDLYETESGYEDFLELLECYGGNRDDLVLQGMVLNLYDFIQSSPWPDTWLQEMTDAYDVHDGLDFGETIWGKVLLESVTTALTGLQEMLEQALVMIKDTEGLERYISVYEDDANHIEELLALSKMENHAKWDILFEAVQSVMFKRLPTAAKETDEQAKEHVKRIRDNVKGEIKRLKESVFLTNSEDTLRDIKTLYPLIQCLTQLVSEFGKRYAAKKSKKSIVDFNDLEHFCLEILSDRDEQGHHTSSKVADSYRERFAEILVDEYQDSNEVQETIVQMISKVDIGTPNVFMVGDVKQSIYRFRQAKPELFLEKYHAYSMEQGELYRKILLFKNFRSRKEIVDAVNFIFKQIMSLRVGELDYTDQEALYPGAAFEENNRANTVVGGPVELHLVQTAEREDPTVKDKEDKDSENEEELPAEEEGHEEEEMLDSIQCEARVVAKKIQELLLPDEEGRMFQVFDAKRKEYRNVKYRDIVVLLRTTKNWSTIFMEELTQQGIPAFADTGTGFFKTTEVQVVLSLLQLIDNPQQDIPLLSVLRSPVVAFTTDELAELRLTDRKVSLFDALQLFATTSEGATLGKTQSFLRELQRWRDMSLYMSTDQLLWQLYTQTGYFATVGALPAGQQRQANLQILFERARQFEETSYKGLFNFINFIDRLKDNKGDMGSAKILGENDNVVRIMSIHKSKGLEFPVVILSGCGKKFNLQDMNKSILLHQELGFGPDFVDHRRRISYPSLPKQAIREKIKIETLSEEMRILYVAMTRAREKLIITGGVRDVAAALTKWDRLDTIKGGRFLDWIGPVLLQHITQSKNLVDPSNWKIRIWNKTEVVSTPITREKDETALLQWLKDLDAHKGVKEYSEEITRRLGWEYPYQEMSKVPAKVSVSELKRRFDTELLEGSQAFPAYLPVMMKKPMFMEEKKGPTGAEMGTALHFVLQHLDFNRQEIDVQINEMVTNQLLTEQQSQYVSVPKIQRFLESPLGKRLLASGNVNREVPFNMEIPCHELYSNIQSEVCQGETLLLQGVIDCYFEEADGWVLVDYKTDYVPNGQVEVIRERYKLQLAYYARALEKLTGKKVKEKVIYLFFNGEVLEM